jgi:hypothetical protein
MTQDKTKTLENQVSELAARVEALEKQLEEHTEVLLLAKILQKKAPPKADVPAPEGYVYLSDFCTQHNIPYHVAIDLFPDKIRGKEVTIGRYNYPVIGQFGRRDFYVRLSSWLGYASCDSCPHNE